MDQQPDKLFRDKLQEYHSAVPPQVWNRVAANVRPKRKSVWWLRAAAAIALIGSAAVFIFSFEKDSPKLADSTIKPSQPVESPNATEPNENMSQPEQATGKTEGAAIAHVDERPSPQRKSATSRKKQPDPEPETVPDISLPEPEPIAIAMEEPVTPAINGEPSSSQQTGRKTVTIVFSAKEVNEKYLSKANPAHATSATEEASTLKNVLDKAYDLTHNQSPLGELRQKKNEILAMNFRKDKPRTQND